MPFPRSQPSRDWTEGATKHFLADLFSFDDTLGSSLQRLESSSVKDCYDLSCFVHVSLNPGSEAPGWSMRLASPLVLAPGVGAFSRNVVARKGSGKTAFAGLAGYAEYVELKPIDFRGRSHVPMFSYRGPADQHGIMAVEDAHLEAEPSPGDLAKGLLTLSDEGWAALAACRSAYKKAPTDPDRTAYLSEAVVELLTPIPGDGRTLRDSGDRKSRAG